jgi:sporulation protein YlmC with PRC-barrel domain
MKKARKFSSKVGIATLCVAAASWLAARAQDAPVPAPNQSQPQPSQRTAAADQPMMTVNRCSKLIGATVRNQQGYTLGKIGEVVVDLDSGRVAYCVLKVKRSGSGKAKYLALPLAALQASEDGLYVVLNADKDKVAQAKGFDANNWPALNNPAWGAQPFWAPKDTDYFAPPVNNPPRGVQPNWNPAPDATKSAADLNKIPPVGNGP